MVFWALHSHTSYTCPCPSVSKIQPILGWRNSKFPCCLGHVTRFSFVTQWILSAKHLHHTIFLTSHCPNIKQNHGGRQCQQRQRGQTSFFLVRRGLAQIVLPKILHPWWVPSHGGRASLLWNWVVFPLFPMHTVSIIRFVQLALDDELLTTNGISHNFVPERSDIASVVWKMRYRILQGISNSENLEFYLCIQFEFNPHLG